MESLCPPVRERGSKHTAVKKIKEGVEGVVSDVFNLRRKSGGVKEFSSSEPALPNTSQGQ